MKEKLDVFLNRLMDVIVPSLILAGGLVTVVGFFYSIILAFRYVADNLQAFPLFSKKQLGYSILFEFLFLVFLAVALFNFFLFPSYSPLLQLLIFSALLFFGLALTGIIFASLWLLSKTSRVSLKELFFKSLQLFFLSIPYWLAALFLLLLTGALSALYPALLIVTLGLNIRVLHALFQQTYEKLDWPLP